MPKFNDLLPDAGSSDTDHFQIPEVGEVWLEKSSGECVSCKELTHWFEPSAHSWMCSTECSKEFWEGFSRAFNVVIENNVSVDDEVGF